MRAKKIRTAVPKKSGRIRATVTPAQTQVMEVLHLLQQKVMGSAALNGGFETLMFKVEKIEEGQAQMGATVNSIHEAIYRPDDGLFARVKDVEQVKEKVAVAEKLTSDVAKLQQWHDAEEKTGAQSAEDTKEHAKLVKLHSDQLDDLVKFKNRVVSIVKWGLVTLSGGIIGGLGKLLYDFVQGHISLNLH